MFFDLPNYHQGSLEGVDGQDDNALLDKDSHVQAHPQLHLPHPSTGTDAPCPSSVDKGSPGEQSESLKQGVEGSEEQSVKRPRIGSVLPAREDSFTTLHSHFLSLQLNERLQFLFWLFEGALASCTHECNESVQSAVHTDSREAPEHGHSKGTQGHGAKLLRWSPEDDARLLNMTEERRSWPEIEKCFPERTYSAIRQRQSTLRKKSTLQKQSTLREQRNKAKLRPIVLI